MKHLHLKIKIYYLIFFILISILIYLPTILGKPFWDDWVFIFKENSDLMTAQSPLDFFPGGSTERSWPIFYLLNWVMIKGFKNNYLYYHLISLFFHGVNTFLTWRLMHKLKLRNSFLTSLIYLAHPLHLFTVGWIIQLKTIFSAFFFLLSLLLCFNFFDKKKPLHLIFSLLSFAASIFTKSTTTVFSICIIACYPLYRGKLKFNRIFYFLIFSMLAISFCAIFKTIVALSSNNFYSPEILHLDFFNLSILDRIMLSLKNLSRYIFFIFLPLRSTDLFQQSSILNYSSFDFLVVLFSSSSIFYFFKKLLAGNHGYPLIGLSFFLLALFPFCGIFFIPMFSTSNFVPHWLSIPLLGLLPLIALSISKKKLVLITVLLVLTSHIQSYDFIETENVYLNSIKHSPENKFIYKSLIEYYIHNQYCDKAASLKIKEFANDNLESAELEKKTRSCTPKKANNDL